jgi:predicted PurR-regulated permease PerM
MMETGSTATSSGAQKFAWTTLIVGLVLLGIWMLRQFMPALTWAVILAIATWPWHRQLTFKINSPRRELWAALISTVTVGVVLIVPLLSGAILAIRESVMLLRLYGNGGGESFVAPAWLQHLPWIGASLTELWNSYVHPTAEGTLAATAPLRNYVVQHGSIIGGAVLGRVVTLALTLLTLFFVYLHGVTLAGDISIGSIRLFGPAVESLLERMVNAARATVVGIVLVAVGQGIVMGVVYAVAGAPHATLLGAATGMFAMIPFAAPIIFAIASCLLASQGALVAAITVFGIGMVLLFVADHFIRPLIIGDGARLPFLWVLLGILGGIESFGLLGIFLGPTLMAALCALWRDGIVPNAASK